MVDDVFMNEIMDSFPDHTFDDDIEDGAVIVNNETPYRPQIGDHVMVAPLRVIIKDDHTEMPYLVESTFGSLEWARESDIKLISRADGVPVEIAKVDLQKELDELVVEIAKMRSQVRALINERDELRNELAEAVLLLTRVLALWGDSTANTIGDVKDFLARHQPPSAPMNPVVGQRP